MLKKITAQIRTEILEIVSAKLKDIGVPHVAINFISGFENSHNLLKRPDLITHARLEILTEESGVMKIVDCIIESAYGAAYDDGVISVSPVDDVFKINKDGKLHSL